MKQLGPWHLSPVAAGGLAVVLMIASPGACAQAAAASAPSVNDPALIEKAHKEGDKVFKWILIHADKPKKAEAKPAPAPTAAAAAAAPAKPVVARAKGEGITERVAPLDPAPAARTAAAAQAEAKAESQPVATAAAAASGTVPGAPASAAEPTTLALAPTSAGAASVPMPEPEPEPEDDLPLVLVHQVDPDFPAAVIRRLQKGAVQVRFSVGADGSVKKTDVVKTSNSRLNEAAQQAVAQWRFMPLKHEQAGTVELAFNLE